MKDGAIELCFQLLSSGRTLDEVLDEVLHGLTGNSAGDGAEHPDLAGETDTIAGAVPPTLTELLIEQAKAKLTVADPLRATAMPSARDDVEAAYDAGIPHLSLPALRPMRAARPEKTGGQATGAPGFPTTERRGLVRRIGLLLGVVLLLAALPSLTYRLLPGRHNLTAVKSPAASAGASAPAHRSAAAPRIADPPTAAPRLTVAATVPASPGTAMAAARLPTVRPTAGPALTRVVMPVPPVLTPAARTPVSAGHDQAAAQPAKATAVVAVATLAAPPARIVEPLPLAHPAVAPSPLPQSAVRALVARGDALLASGDVASARLFYRRGADGGDGAAALRLGESFDPAFLAQAGVAASLGDATKAAFWYERASGLGVRDAALLLRSIAPAKQQ